jgi:RNA polymerase sigma factor FliA
MMEHNADAADKNLTQSLDRDMRLVHRIATAVQRDFGLSKAVEFDELFQSGYVGLLEARERFEPERGPDFRWFASLRIRGAILDGLRKMTNLPRTAHRALRIAAMAQDDDIQSGDTLEASLEVGRLLAGSGFMIVQSPYPIEQSLNQPSPEELAHEKRRAERVRTVVDQLGDPDREIARRRIFEDESVASIALDLGFSRPWAWRVLQRACRNIVLVMDDVS